MGEGRSWDGNWKVRLYARVHRLTRLTRSQFVRELHEVFPDGWPAVVDDTNRFQLAKTLATWTAFCPDTHQERVKQVRAVFRASSPPPGWRPLGPDDELLLTLLPDEET